MFSMRNPPLIAAPGMYKGEGQHLTGMADLLESGNRNRAVGHPQASKQKSVKEPAKKGTKH